MSLDVGRVFGPEAESCDDVSVDAEPLLLDVAGHGQGRADRVQEDKEEEILKMLQCAGIEWPYLIWIRDQMRTSNVRIVNFHT